MVVLHRSRGTSSTAFQCKCVTAPQCYTVTAINVKIWLLRSNLILSYERWSLSHKLGGKLPLLSTRPAVTFPARDHPLGRHQITLDYCNALLFGAPAATFDVLQRVQNNLARVVCQREGRADARPLLRTLHWLPVRQRVIYKTATMTFKAMSSSAPAYLSDLIQTAVPTRSLRSSAAPLLSVPRTRTELTRCAFSVAAPRTWNSLSSDIRSCRTVQTFKRHLKTHLFTRT